MQTSDLSSSVKVNRRAAVDADNPLKILLVGLDSVTDKVVQGLLTVARLPFQTVADASTALTSVKVGEPVDLILTELDLADMDAAEFTRHLRAMDDIHQPPVIALAANQPPGTNDYLPKPIMPPAFYSMLKDWLPPQGIDWPAHIVFATRPALIKDHQTLKLVEALGAIEGLNPEVCQDLFEGDWLAYVKLIKRYLDAHLDDAAKIAQALENADQQTAIRIAHTAKGAAGTIGLYKIQQLALKIEMQLRKPDTEQPLSAPLAELVRLFVTTKQQFDELSIE